MAVSEREAGIVRTQDGNTVILLPPGPIRRKVEGSSRYEHDEVLVDDPDLRRPVGRMLMGSGGTIYKQTY